MWLSKSLSRVGQCLRGSSGDYRITRQVVIKSVVDCCRFHSERDILRRFQLRALTLRGLLGDIESPVEPPGIVLEYLDDDWGRVSRKQRLNTQETSE